MIQGQSIRHLSERIDRSERQRLKLIVKNRNLMKKIMKLEDKIARLKE